MSMPFIVVGAGYPHRLPFVAVCLDVIETKHRHSNPDGSRWVEQMTLGIAQPAITEAAAMAPAGNDNRERNHAQRD